MYATSQTQRLSFGLKAEPLPSSDTERKCPGSSKEAKSPSRIDSLLLSALPSWSELLRLPTTEVISSSEQLGRCTASSACCL